MAKITPYQQGQIASSLVGTPGTSFSGANLMNAVGNEFSQMGAAQHQQYLADLRQKQAEQRALQKHMEDMARKAQVTNIAAGAQVEDIQQMNDLQMKYRNDPGKALQEYTTVSQQKIANTLSQVSDPETNMLLSEKLTQQQASNLERLANWQQSRQVPMAEQNLRDSAGSLSMVTGQMGGSSPQDIKTAIDKYNMETHDQYSFYHQKGLAGQRDANNDAVKEYLEATAAAGDPDLLEKRIHEFADGKYIDPSVLQQVAIQQRGIAAQVRMANNTEATKKDQAAHLDTIRQLIEAGGGDMKSVNPAVAQQILNKNAPNLKPDNLATLTQMVARNATEVQQREASEAALEKALNASPTGKLENTPQSAIQEILKIPHLSPEDREKYTKLLTGNVAALKSKEIDTSVSAAIGQAAAGLDRTAAQIHQHLLDLGKIHDPAKHAAALAQFQIELQRYGSAYSDLQSSKTSIKDPNVRALVELHAKNTEGEFGRIVSILKNEPHAIEAKKQSDALYQAVAPKTIFSDQRQQQYYNYLHKQLYYDKIARLGLTPDQMKAIQADPKRVQALQNMLSKLTADWMHQRGLTH